MVQNRQTGEQMTHWGMLNRATEFGFSLFSMHVRVRHLLSSLVILYHPIAQMQKAHYHTLKLRQITIGKEIIY